jgi:hypothetical protein
VFTVGGFEEIIGAPHTFKGIERQQSMERERQQRAASQDFASTDAEPVSAGGNKSFRTDAPTPDMILLGYYRDRCEQRMQHSTRVLVRSEEQALPLMTRDLSPRGLKVCAKHAIPWLPEQSVTVTFSQFNEEHNANLSEIEYRILSVETTEHEYRACLVQTDQSPNAAAKFIERFIENNAQGARRRRKLDHEDKRLTAYSLLAE